MILARKKLPDGREACLNQPSRLAIWTVELEDGIGGFDSFAFRVLEHARRVFDALPTVEVHEGPFPATDQMLSDAREGP